MGALKIDLSQLAILVSSKFDHSNTIATLRHPHKALTAPHSREVGQPLDVPGPDWLEVGDRRA